MRLSLRKITNFYFIYYYQKNHNLRFIIVERTDSTSCVFAFLALNKFICIILNYNIGRIDFLCETM